MGWRGWVVLGLWVCWLGRGRSGVGTVVGLVSWEDIVVEGHMMVLTGMELTCRRATCVG